MSNKIGEAAAQLGITVRTIRYYEQRGFLITGRDKRGDRLLDETALQRLRYICRLQECGFILTEIIGMLDAAGGSAAPKVAPDVMKAQVTHLRERRAEIERQLASLEKLDADLKTLANSH